LQVLTHPEHAKETLNVVGRSEKRYDGLDHVTGRTKFVDDLHFPEMFYVKVFRSPVVKGIIKNIDVSKAEKTPGVVGVITGHNVPNNRFGACVQDQPVLATDAVRFKGEPIVAVAAVDEDTALEAVGQVEVDIEEQEGVFDPGRAIEPDSPKVSPAGNIYMVDGNPCRKITFGDIDDGFREADEIIEGEYKHPTLEHAQMEPQVSVAVPEANGKLTIYSMSQALYWHQRMLSNILQMPLNKICFVGGTIGGGFGGKNDIQSDHVTAVLALKTGRPVKWRWTREEELLYSSYRGAWNIRIKDGVKKNGRIVARQIRSVREAGGYLGMNPYVVDKYAYYATGTYFIPNVHIEVYCVLTNKSPSSSMRGFGLTPSTFSTEIQMNKIATRLGIDPWEIRFINAYHEGDLTPTQSSLDSVALIEVMQSLAQKAGVALPHKLKNMSSAKRYE
jgi:CO/xanthine dehydrogenase Mo-binding subunit